jgi:hypothetical protein
MYATAHMNKPCPDCGYTRKPVELSPETECPSCGRIYNRITAPCPPATETPSIRERLIGILEWLEGDTEGKRHRNLSIIIALLLAVSIYGLLRERANQLDEDAKQEAARILAAANDRYDRDEPARQARLRAQEADRARLAEEERARRRARETERAKEQKRFDLEIGSVSACQVAISGMLNDPYSAKFERGVPFETSPGRVNVLQELRAKNLFGAYVTNTFYCNLDVTTPGAPRVIHMERVLPPKSG